MRLLVLVASLFLVACGAAPRVPAHAAPRMGAIVGPGGSSGPVYKASPPALTDGQGTPSLVDSLGDLQVNSATKLAGEDLSNDLMKVENRYSYYHQSGATAGVNIKSGAGFIHCVTVSPVASTVVTLDDALTATTPTIAVWTWPASLVSGPQTFCLDVVTTVGVELVVTTGGDVVVSYR